MKAIDVRCNRALFNERDIKILRSYNLTINDDEKKVKGSLSHNGCPYELAKWYDGKCRWSCDECWKQEPNEIREDD